MAKGPGGTRSGNSGNPTGNGSAVSRQENLSSRYARATVFDRSTPFSEGQNYIERMRQDLNQFADRENADFREGRAVFKIEGNNVSRFEIYVSERPASGDTLVVSYKVERGAYQLPTYTAPDYNAYRKAMSELEGKEFNSIEEAYREAEDVLRRVNKMRIKVPGARVQGD